MSESAHDGEGFLKYCAIAESGTLRANGDDSYMLSHITSFNISSAFVLLLMEKHARAFSILGD